MTWKPVFEQKKIKPGKPDEEIPSYKPTLLATTKYAYLKLFEKLLLRRLKPIVNVSVLQFGFSNRTD